MSFWEYTKDRKLLIIFFLILMMFISTVIWLDPNVKVGTDNIFYINFVSIVLFVMYIIGGYIYRKRYYSAISEIIGKMHEDIINYLPEPKNYEQKLLNQVLKRIYNEQIEKIDTLHEEKRENNEYMTSWVHEVKTPISVIKLTLENSYNKSEEEILKSISEEIEKIENQVEQALYYSRTDSFSSDYFINEMSLPQLVKDAVKRHAKTFINKSIRIDIQDIAMDALTDRKWLGFILDQILSNSLKYTTEGGSIRVSFEADKMEKRMIVEDNGIGIREEDLGRVFEKGFTGHTGRRYYKSTGMGLYLAKKLSRKLGHDITIESMYNQYTRVIVHFPKLTDYYNVTKM